MPPQQASAEIEFIGKVAEVINGQVGEGESILDVDMGEKASYKGSGTEGEVLRRFGYGVSF